ncbi:hypothetical protein GH714_005946 [Hevea brasiliensis]|uniref:Uncharacterized protein n=1 Tax=Hevea brasiliensis TaxID=3981 RepID=A0A6A6LIH4_HEVBR|nr:hypothetical protein GH714_005946 [Hevea brasiliensis]
MELRSCTHLHFILVAKGGLATKALNVYHGRPALKFKKVKDLYETDDENFFDPFPVFRPKVEFECGEAEILHTVAEERATKSDGEISESNSKGFDVGAREIDDLNFGNMTLKQIREKFRGNPSDEVVFQSNENFPSPIAVKLEDPVSTYSACKDIIIIDADSSFSCNELVAFNGVAPCEEPEAANDYYLETGTSMIASAEPDTAKGSVSEIGMSVITSEELATNACGIETQMTTLFSNEPQCCATNEESHEYMEHKYPKSIQDVKFLGGEIMIEGAAEVISNKFSDFSLSDVKKEGAIIDQHPKNDSPETVFPREGHIPVLQHQRFPYVHEKSWKTSSSSQVHIPNVAINNHLQCIENSKKHNSCLPGDETKDDTLDVEANVISSPNRDCSSLWNPNLHSSPRGCLVSAADNSPTAEEKQSRLSACADATGSCSPVIHSCIDEPVISAKVEDCCHSKMQHPPERLFSTRMAISPTSQKRLREVMESIELDDEQYYRYARKLCYRKQNKYKNGRLEGPIQIKRAELITSPKKVSRKPKICKNGFHRNDILKVPPPSRAGRCFSTGCTSALSSSESAILFSQQQMHDIESVATKLAKELQLMKDIVEETLQSKVYLATSSKYDAEEIRLAIQSATRVEESARRSLSIMARDCNRFCKIMKLAKKNSADSRDGVCKKRKIVFADEAGGKLCDVKTFRDGMDFFVEAKSEKTGTFD